MARGTRPSGVTASTVPASMLTCVGHADGDDETADGRGGECVGAPSRHAGGNTSDPEPIGGGAA